VIARIDFGEGDFGGTAQVFDSDSICYRGNGLCDGFVQGGLSGAEVACGHPEFAECGRQGVRWTIELDGQGEAVIPRGGLGRDGARYGHAQGHVVRAVPLERDVTRGGECAARRRNDNGLV